MEKDNKLELLVDDVKQRLLDWSESDEVTMEGTNTVKMTFDKDSSLAVALKSEDEYQHVVCEVREDNILIKYSYSTAESGYAQMHTASIESADVAELTSHLEGFIIRSHKGESAIPGTTTIFDMNTPASQ